MTVQPGMDLAEPLAAGDEVAAEPAMPQDGAESNAKPTNDDPDSRAQEALDLYGDDPENALVDLLADLLHVAPDFDSKLDEARGFHAAESQGAVENDDLTAPVLEEPVA